MEEQDIKGGIMSLSKKIRFEVFKRDGFKCQYCGKAPPDVVLEVDHINPVAEGGEDDLNNLLCACFDCNRGKKNIPLEKIPSTLQDNLEVLREKELQLKEYNRFLKRIQDRVKREMDEVNAIYESNFPGWRLSESFYNVTLKRFFESLPKQSIIQAMQIACNRITDKDKVINYFCGICWNNIKSKTDPHYLHIKELARYWQSQPKGSGYLREEYLRHWLKTYEIGHIMSCMDEARGRWRDLCTLLGEP